MRLQYSPAPRAKTTGRITGPPQSKDRCILSRRTEAMAAKTNQQLTIDFLDALFGEEPDGPIYVCAKREDSSGDAKTQHKYYSHPTSIDTKWWTENVSRNNMWFCTGTALRTKDKIDDSGSKIKARKAAENIGTISSLWFDIDACKKLFNPQTKSVIVDGSEFLGELRTQVEDVTAWVRSSEHGIQGYFKLDEPITLDGDKAKFKEEIEPVLIDIAWYFGADFQTTHIGTLMRLPGTLNVKREYSTPFSVKASLYPDRVSTFKSLKKRFTPDLAQVPVVVSYAMLKVIQEIWESGYRHPISLELAASIRKAGLDRKSCERLFKELHKVLEDDEDRLSEIETTYERDIDEIRTLRAGDWAECASAVDEILEFWRKHKEEYAKKRGLEWHPEVDPTRTKRSAGDLPFYVRDNQTFYIDADGEQKRVANFALRVVKKIIRAEDRSLTWLTEINKPGAAPMLTEVPAEKHNSWRAFSTVKPIPSGIGFGPTSLWTQYIMQLDEEAADSPTVRETPYYGFLAVREGNPVLLLPGTEREDYVWLEERALDTAMPGALTKELSPKAIAKYLTGLGQYYPLYHDKSYAYSALGFFCACSIAAFFRSHPRVEGFPTLSITGLKGSGKSTLISQVLGPHYGCSDVKSFAQRGTTVYAIRRRLASNNVCPYILDEFKDENEIRTTELQGIIRSLWNRYIAESGTASGGIRSDHLEAPLVVIGEHPYSDEATLDRTFSVRVHPTWVKAMRDASTKRKHEFEAAQNWLHDSHHLGKLGTILLSYVGEHMDEVNDLIDTALELVEQTSPLSNERKNKGFAAVFAGVLLLEKIYKQHDIKFFIKGDEILNAIYTADPQVEEGRAPDSSTLRTLFTATDKIIVEAIRTDRPYAGIMYIFDNQKRDTIYFQRTRWFDLVNSVVRSSNSAALKNDRAFEDLLKENVGNVIVGFPKNHPRFKEGCIEVDLKQIAKTYHINVDSWRDEE